jgi:hypothetical protein
MTVNVENNAGMEPSSSFRSNDTVTADELSWLRVEGMLPFSLLSERDKSLHPQHDRSELEGGISQLSSRATDRGRQGEREGRRWMDGETEPPVRRSNCKDLRK